MYIMGVVVRDPDGLRLEAHPSTVYRDQGEHQKKLDSIALVYCDPDQNEINKNGRK